MFHYDNTVQLSDLVQTATLVLTIFLAYNGITSRMASVETKVDAMWKWFLSKKDVIND